MIIHSATCNIVAIVKFDILCPVFVHHNKNIDAALVFLFGNVLLVYLQYLTIKELMY